MPKPTKPPKPKMTKSKAKISEFRPQRQNANKHTARGLGMLDKSMGENGFIGAMTSAADGEIFDGSARLETAYERFGDDIEPIIIEADGTRPIIVKRIDIPSADDPRAKKMAIAANRIAAVDLDWDADVLASIADEVDISDMFFEEELAAILNQDEEEEKEEIANADDKGIAFNNKYAVIVECDSELLQESTYDFLHKQGYKCKLVTL